MAATGGGAAQIGGAAESGDHPLDRRGRITKTIDLQCGTDEEVDGIEPGHVRIATVGAHGAIGADGKNVGARLNIVLHARFTAKGIDVFDESGFNRRDQGGVGSTQRVATWPLSPSCAP